MAGGARLTEGGLARGYFVAPTVFAGVRDDMHSACKKTFAPVLSARLFADSADSADAITRAKASEHGLGSGVWSHNVSTVHRVARRLRTGTVWANGYLAMDPAVPFGGAKMSSFGHECGPDHRHEYLQTRAVLIQLDQGPHVGSKAGLASSPTATATSSRLCHCDQSPRRAGDAWRRPGAALKA